MALAKASISTNFFIILFLLLSTPPPSYSNNQTDFEALMAFKKSIDNDPLGALSSWNYTTNFCRWNGVSCGKRHPDRVVSLSLRSQGLVGWLSPHIGNLSFLRNIILPNNTFRGPIPQEMGRLRRLQAIEFSSNSFGGGIPTNLSHCRNLYWLNLSGNVLTGSIVPEIASLVNLNNLALSRNMLSGSIPPFLGNLTNLFKLSLRECGLQGEIPESLIQLRRMRYLLIDGNNLRGNIPFGLFNISSIEKLTLGDNKLHGTIPSSFTLPNLRIPDGLRALRGLQYLDLSQNNFSGKIPTFLADFRLLYLNLSFNALQGEIPTRGVFQNESAISIQGNHHLCGGIAILNLPSCSSPNSNKKIDLGKILIPIGGAICLALSLLCFCVIIYRRRTSQKVGTPASIFMVPEFLRLSYADLLKATGGFSESNLVGAGRFGSVYKGTIINDDEDEQKDVAVKVLNLNTRGAYKSLATECNALRGIRHRNLLKIISVCDSIDFQENAFKALVYEFMANGSLENWLHQNSEEQGRILSIIQRLEIAIDIASGVDYLHGGSESIVIHGDLKPSNILLDQDMVAHVGDFGLAKIIPRISQNMSASEGSSSIAIKGTIGYIPPEYGMNNVVSTQGDAYSFGILVLEMFTNRRPTSDSLDGYANLQDFVCNALPNRITEVVDPFLHDELNKGHKYLDCIVSILRIGVRCSMELPRDRMLMAEVVNELKKIKSVFVANRQGRNVAPEQH